MTRAIEAGILPLFRLFVGLEILLLLMRIGLEAVFRADFPLVPSPWTALALLVVLLGYLSWPGLEQRLGRWYLPSALVFSTGLTLVSAAAGMNARLAAGIRAEELVRASWLGIVLLVVPVMLVAWQYGFRRVLWFCLVTTIADLVLTSCLAAAGSRLGLTLIVLGVVRCLFFVPVGYAVARLAEAQRRQRQALAEANAQLACYATALEQLAVSRERNRLAHELHDTLAHGLSSLAIQLEAMNALWTSQPESARAMLAEALATTRTALREARRAIVALRASPLEDLGLAEAVRELAGSAAARAGLKLDLHVSLSLDGLSTDAEHALYRVAAEALANVVRHAEARRLTVRLEESGPDVNLLVADDGRGFDPVGADPQGRFCVDGMRQRARLIGGELRVDSAPGTGTAVRLTVRRSHDSRPDLR
jgi:signal transduction histidine kinase